MWQGSTKPDVEHLQLFPQLGFIFFSNFTQFAKSDWIGPSVRPLLAHGPYVWHTWLNKLTQAMPPNVGIYCSAARNAVKEEQLRWMVCQTPTEGRACFHSFTRFLHRHPSHLLPALGILLNLPRPRLSAALSGSWVVKASNVPRRRSR